MPWIERLAVQNVRNLAECVVELGSGVNVFVGGNGAGKTSILEAVFLLAYGRSFRTRRLSEVRAFGKDRLGVEGRVRVGAGSRKVGFRFHRGVGRGFLEGRPVNGQREVASGLPVGIHAPGPGGVVWGGADERRRFLDWVVFHVEQDYGRLVHRYRHALKQRNMALRGGEADRAASAWDQALVALGEQIDRQRRQVVAALAPAVERVEGSGAAGDAPVRLGYEPGFPDGEGIAAALRRALGGDRGRGYTSVGPHMADLKFTVGEARRGAKGVLSRGQGKALALGLLVEGACYIRGETGVGPCVMVDDFDAELDEGAVEGFVDRVVASGLQCYLTTLGRWRSERAANPVVFHVKQGRVETA